MKNLLAVEIGPNLLDASGTKSVGDTYKTVSPLISSLLKNSLILAGIILLGLILFGGFGMIASAGSGDSKKAEQSKKTITSALIGFAIVFCAYFIIQIIETITGLNILNNTTL